MNFQILQPLFFPKNTLPSIASLKHRVLNADCAYIQICGDVKGFEIYKRCRIERAKWEGLVGREKGGGRIKKRKRGGVRKKEKMERGVEDREGGGGRRMIKGR